MSSGLHGETRVPVCEGCQVRAEPPPGATHESQCAHEYVQWEACLAANSGQARLCIASLEAFRSCREASAPPQPPQPPPRS